MGTLIDINHLPLPILIINTVSRKILTNSHVVDIQYFNTDSLDELSDKLKIDFNNLPSLPFSKDISHTKKDGVRETIKFTFSRQSSEEIIISAQIFKLDLNVLFKNRDFQEMYDDLPLGIIVKNLDLNKTLYVSEYLSSKIEYTFEEISSKSWNEFTYKDDIKMQEDIMSESIHNSLSTLFFEKRIVSKTGKIYWFSEYIKTLKFDSELFQFVVLRDISNEKDNEAELQRAKQLVEDAERLKSAFLDNMPHEIRTPLHAITGFTSLLSDSDLSHDERLEYVKFIQDSSNDILNLMDNIIEIAKLETNQVKPKREKCYINSIIDKLYNDILSKQNILEKEHLNIKVSKGNSDPVFMIISDPERIYQILSHLLNNALKFTDEGGIEFGYLYPKNNRIEFFVKDTGIGIDPTESQIIFKKFGKSGNINTNKNRGSGLGLTLSKKLVELLNGEITFDSSKGKGSTFKFYITLENEQKISITKPSVSGNVNWSTKTILIAEDTESNYFFIEAFLERTHVNLIWAQDGLEAVNLFRENDVDLVLMDIMMPEKDGYDATREIKEINSNVPVIAQTALALPDDETKCYNAGCDYVLVKPINSEDLIATIKRFIL